MSGGGVAKEAKQDSADRVDLPDSLGPKTIFKPGVKANSLSLNFLKFLRFILLMIIMYDYPS